MSSTHQDPSLTESKSDDPDAERWGRPKGGWRLSLYRVIYESDTPAGRRFDKWLIALILASLVVVIAESEEPLRARWALAFDVAEWGFTLLFTVEYLLRLACIDRPARYARSFFGVVDFLSIAPTYLAVLFPGLHALIDVRVLRLLRVFRIFKLTSFIREYQSLGGALAASWRKITVFVSVVAMVVVVMGTLMYVVEGPANGFTSILTTIYWAATTMTTTGYGDITPKSELGRVITTLMMLLGWGTLAVPTGIVTTEMALQRRSASETLLQLRSCPACGHAGHVLAARHCSQCGSAL